MISGDAPPRSQLVVGRYVLHRRIASGGMAAVYFGRLLGIGGFSRVVAIKRLHPQFASDSEFVDALLDEARLVSRIRHPNVVPVLDVVAEGDEVLLVMEYVHGEKLSTLLRRAKDERRTPVAVAVAIICDTLRGLHAAHEAKGADGKPLELVHRDVSPQNVLVSSDGVALVADFGIAKAVGRSHTTREGQLKGKLAYMAFEQLNAGTVTRRTDVYAAAIVLWEMLAGERLFGGDSEGEIYAKVMQHAIVPIETRVPDLPAGLAQIVARGLARDPADRFDDALAMASALEAALRPATRAEIGAWLGAIAADVLEERARELAQVEQSADDDLSSRPLQRPAIVQASGSSTAEPPRDRVEATQVSSLSLSRPASPFRARSRPLGLVLVALVAVGAIGLWAVRAFRAHPIAEVELAAPSSEPEPSAPATAIAIPAPSAEPAPAPPDAGAPDVAPRAKVRAVKPSTKPVKPSGPCRVLGADGIWRIKPSCL